MSDGLKRFLVFVCGVPGYILTLVPWLFCLGLLMFVVVQRLSPQYQTYELPNIQYVNVSFLSPNTLVMAVASIVLWLFMAWLTKRILLLFTGFVGHDEKSWRGVQAGALIGGWAFVLVLAIFVFQSVKSGFLLSELFVISVGLASFALEYFAQILLIKKPA